MAEHDNEFSPSSSERWSNCAGSVVLEADEPNTDSEFSKEGTLAHAIAAHCLEKNVDTHDILFFTLKDEVQIVPMEMREYVQEYVDFIREESKGHELMIEQKLDLSILTGKEGSRGTADAVILDNDGQTLRVWDFKYGFQPVQAEGNSQLRVYSYCSADVLSPIASPQVLVQGIFQNRIGNINSESISIREMEAFAEKIRAAVRRVRQAQKSNSLEGFLNPSEKTCQWCKAKYKCPALAAEVIKATAIDFDDETQTELIEPVDLAKAGAKLALVENWIKGVRAKITSELFSGRSVEGWKLVEGKKGNRSFIDETDAKKELIAAGADPKDITETKLLTPAKIEKKLKGNDKALNLLPKLYSQKAGKPAVAPISDKRPAYTLKPEDDFSDVGDDE